jgi:prepilin-type processing-associated H-X9-DG protein
MTPGRSNASSAAPNAAWFAAVIHAAPAVADYDSLVAENATVEKTQHATGFNMLLADGHTEHVKTAFLLSTNVVSQRRWNHDNSP